mmetsp:Transcript_7661/g.11259  ORF Transcript_7661/g.11259 Transcript_7661/m.11259 type:complete len:154 (-) Transcript_7661:419-880(-)
MMMSRWLFVATVSFSLLVLNQAFIQPASSLVTRSPSPSLRCMVVLELAADQSPSRFAQQLEDMRKKMGLPEDILNAAKDSDKLGEVEEAERVEAKREEKRKKKPFVSIEEWDKAEKQKAKENGFSWDEKVQFDGLRHGNKNRQNDIVMKNLFK